MAKSFNTFVTYEMMYNDILHHLIPKIPKDVSAVIGIPRSGMIPATIISTELHIPMGILGCNDFFAGNRLNAETVKGKILLIDDSVNYGETYKANNENIKKIEEKFEVIRSCVYMRKGKERYAPLFAKYLHVPRIFEWNLFNSSKIKNMIFDLDGVFCQDNDIFDDDGLKYQEGIKNAVPLHIPTYPVKAICTSRIERWRGITEAWLAKYDIKYEYLFMMPFKTANERRKRGNKAKYKAEKYLEVNASLFIESSKKQAKGIAKFSKKKVLSLEDKKIY